MDDEHPKTRRARLQRANAERQRVWRAKRKEGGLPDPRVVDASIADALRDLLDEDHVRHQIREAGTMEGMTVPLSRVLAKAAMALVEHRKVKPEVARTVVIEALLPRPAEGACPPVVPGP